MYPGRRNVVENRVKRLLSHLIFFIQMIDSIKKLLDQFLVSKFYCVYYITDKYVYCPSVLKMCKVFRVSSYGQRSCFYPVSEFDVKPATCCHSILVFPDFLWCIFCFYLLLVFFSLSFFSFFPFIPFHRQLIFLKNRKDGIDCLIRM